MTMQARPDFEQMFAGKTYDEILLIISDSKYTVAGKTLSEIVLMEKGKRGYWYKKLLQEGKQEEKEEAMKIVSIVKRTKQSEFMTGKGNPFFNKTHTKEVCAKLKSDAIERWKDPKYRDKMSGETAPAYGKTWALSDATKAKQREVWTPERRDEKSVAMTGIIRSDATKAKQREAWTPKRRVEKSVSWMGKDNPNYIDGRASDPQYDRRYRLRRCGLPEDFIEASFHQKKHRTDIEKIIEYSLLTSDIFDYEFQKRIEFNGFISHTIVDFFVEPNFCVYVDGNTHINNNRYGFNQQDKDIAIDKELMRRGFIPLRLWHRDILNGDRPWLALDIPRQKYEQQTLEAAGRANSPLNWNVLSANTDLRSFPTRRC